MTSVENGLMTFIAYIRSITLALGLVLIIAGCVRAQSDYIAYNGLITQASHDVMDGNLAEALVNLDSVHQNFDFVFASHWYMGLQIASRVRDTSRVRTYLTGCLAAGIPIRLLVADSFIAPYYMGHERETASNPVPGTAWHPTLNRRVSDSICRIIDALYDQDQAITRKLNESTVLRPFYWFQWTRHSRKCQRTIFNIIKKYGYPGERMCGVSTLDHVGEIGVIMYGTNCFINNHKALFMLIHYYSNHVNYIGHRNLEVQDSLLYANVLSGYMSAYEYGVLNDFMAENGGRKNKYRYFGMWLDIPGEESCIQMANQRRIELGLCTVAKRNDYQRYWLNIRR